MEYDLVRVTPNYRGVISANINDIWEIVKVWAPSLWIRELKGIPCSFHVLVSKLSFISCRVFRGKLQAAFQ